MPTVEEIMNQSTDDTNVYENGNGTYTVPHENIEVLNKPRFEVPQWLKSPTGGGSIESYVNHPLNFNGSWGLAQVIRGLTGIFTNLDYAVIDIVMGALKMSNASKPKGAALLDGGNSGGNTVS